MIIEVPVPYVVRGVRTGRRTEEKAILVARVPVRIEEASAMPPVAVRTRPDLVRLDEGAGNPNHIDHWYVERNRVNWYDTDRGLMTKVLGTSGMLPRSRGEVSQAEIHVDDLARAWDRGLERGPTKAEQFTALKILGAGMNPFLHPRADIWREDVGGVGLVLPEGTGFRSCTPQEGAATRDEAIAHAVAMGRSMLAVDGVLLRRSDGPVWNMNTSGYYRRDIPTALYLGFDVQSSSRAGNTQDPDFMHRFRADALEAAGQIAAWRAPTGMEVFGDVEIVRPGALSWDHHGDEARRIAQALAPVSDPNRVTGQPIMPNVLGSLEEAGYAHEADGLREMLVDIARHTASGSDLRELEHAVGGLRSVLHGMTVDAYAGEPMREHLRGLALTAPGTRGGMAGKALERVAIIHSRCLMAIGAPVPPPPVPEAATLAR